MIKIIQDGIKNRAEIFASVTEKPNVEGIVSDILQTVKAEGDKALFAYAEKFDKAVLSSLRVTDEEIAQAVASVEPEFLEVLKKASANIREYHELQKRKGFELVREGGVVVGQKVLPIERVGLYVPGGTASYPSTVLMDAIPAIVAGCERVVMVSPPNKEGKINPVILASAYVAGVKEIYKVGGAQAIGALAYGTESVPKVDKIVGPGNAFVAEAKRQVFGEVSIDMIAGPSEILVVEIGRAHV